MQFFYMVLVGIAAGVCSGLFGIGGGTIIVPILILWFGFSAHGANGTSLVALLLPVGLLGVMEYYRDGKISVLDIKMGLFIALGLFAGTFLGARVANLISGAVLQKMFAVFFALLALRMWFAAKA